MARFRLTEALIASDPDGFQRATQSPFLRNAARGAVPKDVLGRWLANDRLYIHGYIRGIGRLLSFLALPQTVPERSAASGAEDDDEDRETPATRLLAWMIDALVNIRREERFFVDTAHDFGIVVNLPASAEGRVPDEAKIEGLRRFEALFAGLGPGRGDVLPWLECAVVFYGTEKCYLDAWSYAKSLLQEGADPAADADGGALRKEFIPNWTSEEFIEFVDELGDLINEAVEIEIRQRGEGAKQEILERSLAKWRELLAAEQAFWPAMQG
ncbi:hypothetical protein VFPFJ_08814 [Purpureocillium lilacinum]|uniref:Transcription regulator n=1 Tax=Purpureocillium lilacinum TaxID=33203 RepID=A0A179GCM3_PURLI|nr:hypothetical protein VFPFJ_08814 [Purpureocillium lilacinum]KAK4088174.1 hypothetical protein Purlil1_7367 [Purpureocillium lilacinum]OAQ74899.1 transcription regulator [Purpureocillium lilacinum]OAQ83011.1 hypothetical protein VFPFJ_08814 [Purpureocillium lilacinum]GJN70679.1 hypothetical protein PLICBS_004737 [Purpureocillium lilacinum]GJN79218.1 hypothetical protein PLIIFM63780_002731 [Purpureocillium lilacinum]